MKRPIHTCGKPKAKAWINHLYSSPTSYCISISHPWTTLKEQSGVYLMPVILEALNGTATSMSGFLLPEDFFHLEKDHHWCYHAVPSYPYLFLLCSLRLTFSHHTLHMSTCSPLLWVLCCQCFMTYLPVVSHSKHQYLIRMKTFFHGLIKDMVHTHTQCVCECVVLSNVTACILCCLFMWCRTSCVVVLRWDSSCSIYSDLSTFYTTYATCRWTQLFAHYQMNCDNSV